MKMLISYIIFFLLVFLLIFSCIFFVKDKKDTKSLLPGRKIEFSELKFSKCNLLSLVFKSGCLKISWSIYPFYFREFLTSRHKIVPFLETEKDKAKYNSIWGLSNEETEKKRK